MSRVESFRPLQYYKRLLALNLHVLIFSYLTKVMIFERRD
jgi:hypothetical protein